MSETKEVSVRWTVCLLFLLPHSWYCSRAADCFTAGVTAECSLLAGASAAAAAALCSTVRRWKSDGGGDDDAEVSDEGRARAVVGGCREEKEEEIATTDEALRFVSHPAIG